MSRETVRATVRSTRLNEWLMFPPSGSRAVAILRPARVASAKGSSRSASSFLGEFTRVEIGHIAIGSEGKG